FGIKPIVSTEDEVHGAMTQAISLEADLATEPFQLMAKVEGRVEQGIPVCIAKGMDQADVDGGQLVHGALRSGWHGKGQTRRARTARLAVMLTGNSLPSVL